MSWSDIFYPENPKRRQKIIRLCSKLATLLESNFKRTNELIDCIHKNVPGSRFSKIHLDHDESLKKNSEVLINRLNEIDRFLEERLREMSETLDPSVFRELTSPDMSFSQRLQIARKVSDVTIKIGGTVAGIVITTWIRQETFLVLLSARLGTLTTCCVASVAVGLLFVGADMLVSAILGAIERNKLEEAIADLEATMYKFEPVSDDFNRSIERLVIRIDG